MNKSRNILLLVGSPGGASSTSASLGHYILDQLAVQGFVTTELNIQSEVQSSDLQTFCKTIDDAEIILLTFPLYVDSLPAPVINTLELIRDRRVKSPVNNQKLIAIVNCGFPEASHNEWALAICEQFAQEAGIHWMGGLSLGMGGVVHGKPVSELGGIGTNIVNALDLVVESIVQKEDKIPEEAIEYMATPPIPYKWMYTSIASISWIFGALKNKVLTKIGSKPFV